MSLVVRKYLVIGLVEAFLVLDLIGGFMVVASKNVIVVYCFYISLSRALIVLLKEDWDLEGWDSEG